MKYSPLEKKVERITKKNKIPITIVTFILLVGLFIVYNYKPSEESIEREFLAPPITNKTFMFKEGIISNNLFIEFNITLEETGIYRINAELKDNEDNIFYPTGSNKFNLSSGENTVFLNFNATQLYLNKINGSYELTRLDIQRKDFKIKLKNVYNTSVYNYTDFEYIKISINQTPEELINQTPEETINQTPEETINQTPEELINQTPEETINQTPEETINQTPEEVINKTPEETINQTPEETINQTQDIINQTKEIINQTIEETINQTDNQTINQTPEETINQTPEETINKTINDTNNEIIEEINTRTITSGGGGGGGGGSSNTKTYAFGELTSPIQLSLIRNNIVTFYLKEEYHKINVIKIGKDYVELTIKSDPITVLVYIGLTKRLDINNDRVDDIYIKLNDIKSRKAEITIGRIKPKIKLIFCNNNGVCDKGENSANCPKDCPKEKVISEPVKKAPKYIEKIICDYNEICDNDETTMTCPTDCKRNYKDKIIVSLITLLAIIMICFIVFEYKHHQE
ncbi:hypothetical protein CEE44_05075 [Candidatus Woesearchaeota archaeon B3_Woes]|nr:MAG: hypothetical protein CEE44_05075 [Candidatus Woesearchaeota archaeon B3_Woes]